MSRRHGDNWVAGRPFCGFVPGAVRTRWAFEVGRVECDVQVMRCGPCAARRVGVVEGLGSGQAGCLFVI